VVLVLFSFTRSLALSLSILVVVGAVNITINILANALVQSLVPDAVRGRVMAIYMLSFFGFMPLGALLAGTVASAAGVPHTVAASAVCTLLCALVVARAVPSLRRAA